MPTPQDFPKSYLDPTYAQLDAAHEQKLGLPVGMLQSVRTDGERTDHGKVSSAGARTPYQITPETRKAVLDQYGIDAYLSPQNASEVAGMLLRDSLKRSGGDPETAVREYHGGTDSTNWGKQNNAYWKRVSAGMQDKAIKAMSEQFGKWMDSNQGSPTPPAVAQPSTAGAVTPAMANAFGSWLAGGDQIPGAPVPKDRLPPDTTTIPPPANNPGLIDKAIGTGEAGLSAITGMTTGTLGMAAGTAKGLTQAILDGSFGTKQAADMVEQSAMQGMQAGTYQPRTQSGQDQTAALGEAMAPLMAVAPIMGEFAPLAQGGRAAVPASVAARTGAESVARSVAGDAGAAAAVKAGDAVANGAQRVATMAKGATTLPRRALEAVTGGADEAKPTPGTLTSGGAAATDMATQRQATAGNLPVPIELTKGQATRDPMQLKFEVETAKQPEIGAPLRENTMQQNQSILGNFDHWIDSTGAEAPTLRATGQAVDKPLVAAAARDKAEIRVAYKNAEKAGELEAPVTLDSVVSHLNESGPEAATAPLLTVARNKAIQTGVAEIGPDGNLVAKPVPLKIAEEFRKSIGAATDYTPTNIRQATIIKGLVDEATDGMGGNLYKQARALRAKYAQTYEDRAVISKLLNNKRGTSDRQVALEDVWNHSIMNGSLDDVTHLHDVLKKSGADGQQAWKELQGATLQHVRDEAFGNVATDASGNRVVSPAKLDKVIRALDADGKLDFIFGKQGAQQMRDIRDISQFVKTVPPEAAINFSNTAATLLAAFGDAGLVGMTGLPVPVTSLTKALIKHVRDAKLKARVADALNKAARKQDKPSAPAGNGF